MQKRPIVCLLLVALAAASAVAQSPANPRLRLATTTSTENSGLLSFLLPVFTRETGYQVSVVAVGTGATLRLGQNGDADVLLVHARALEDAFMAAGWGEERRDVMYNDFIVVGPKSDPARLKGAPNSAEAFKRIAGAQAVFVSRGDNSGTHVKEREIWQAAGLTPQGVWYKEAGQGMEPVIIMAGNLAGYTLTDRATWMAVRDKVALEIVYEGDPALFNPYGIITVNPARHRGLNVEGARALLSWMTSQRGQALIADFKIAGQTLFFPNYNK